MSRQNQLLFIAAAIVECGETLRAAAEMATENDCEQIYTIIAEPMLRLAAAFREIACRPLSSLERIN